MSTEKTFSAEPVIRCTNLNRFLGKGDARVHVLRDVSFAASRGTVTAIVGPSGCGKSTLLYTLGLLDRPDSGSVFIGDGEFSQASDEARTQRRSESLGFIFQFHFLLPEFSALENVLLPMRKRGHLSEVQMRERGLELLAEVGLAEKSHRLATELSGGEQQRVAVARALANQPLALLADEPTGNLDHANSSRVFDLLYRLARQHGLAVVLVTHNPEIASRCDRTLRMSDGVFLP